MEKEKCEHYSKTQEGYFLGKKNIICPIENCPYDNQIKVRLSGDITEICKTKGLVRIAVPTLFGD